MNTEQPAEGFLRHRGLIFTAAGGAVVEDGLLVLLAPSARSVAPQGTAVPSLAAYHDLRWLFAGTESWLWFAVVIAAVLVTRAAFDVLLLRLAWPAGVPAPRGRRAFASCAALTLVAWLMLLDHLIGSISPYGPAGAQSLLSSVGRVGARYFDQVVAEAASGTGSLRWLTIVPLADAVTLPDCSLPADVIVVPAFHGGLLGDPAVLPMISRFLAGRVVTQSDGSMREAAEMITGAAAAWRLPDLSASCS